MTRAEQYAADELKRKAVYWKHEDGDLHIPPDVLASYLANAWLDGAIAQVREAKQPRPEPTIAENFPGFATP